MLVIRSAELERGLSRLRLTPAAVVAGLERLGCLRVGRGLAGMTAQVKHKRRLMRGIGYRFLRECVAHRLAPALVAALDGVAGGSGGHGVEPPALLGDQAEPVLDGGWDQGGVRLLDGPGEQHQLIAEQARDGVGAGLPTAGLAAVLLQAFVEFDPRLVGDGVPLGTGQHDAQLALGLAEGEGGRRCGLALVPGHVLGDQHVLAVAGRNGDQEVVDRFLRAKAEAGAQGFRASYQCCVETDQACQGFMLGTPAASKSATSRVTTVSPWRAALAAISTSGWLKV